MKNGKVRLLEVGSASLIVGPCSGVDIGVGDRGLSKVVIGFESDSTKGVVVGSISLAI